MNSFSVYSFSLSRASVIPDHHPNALPFHCKTLHLNLTQRHYHSTTILSNIPLHPRQEVSPPVFQHRSIFIPPTSLCNPRSASSFLKQYIVRSHGITLSMFEFESLKNCILGLGSGMGVVADVLIERTDVVRMRMRMPHVVLPFPSDDETIIFDAVGVRSSSCSASAGGNSKKLLLEEITFDSVANRDGVAACLICLDEFEDGCTAVSTPCSHFFHDECIYKWIENTTEEAANCPLCRFLLFR